MARALSLTAALLLAGCVDFIEPEVPEPPQQGGFHLAALAWRDSLHLTATLIPGRDGDAVRSVVDSALWLGDSAIAPLTTQPDPYSVRYTVLRPLEDTIVALTPPAVSGVAGLGPYVVPLAQRDGPDTLRIASGESVVLRLVLPQAAAGTAARSWDLLAGGGQQSFRASGAGAPPATLEIPPELVPDSGTWYVMLTDEHRFLDSLVHEVWEADVAVARRLLWTVIIEPAP